MTTPDERVEAALWAGDWPITDKFIERMSNALAAADAARDTTGHGDLAFLTEVLQQIADSTKCAETASIAYAALRQIGAPQSRSEFLDLYERAHAAEALARRRLEALEAVESEMLLEGQLAEIVHAAIAGDGGERLTTSMKAIPNGPRWSPGKYGYVREATLFENDENVLEIGERKDGSFDLISHQRHGGNVDKWDDVTIWGLKPEHLAPLASLGDPVADYMREYVAGHPLTHLAPSVRAESFLRELRTVLDVCSADEENGLRALVEKYFRSPDSQGAAGWRNKAGFKACDRIASVGTYNNFYRFEIPKQRKYSK